MANQGAKKRKEENARHMKNLRRLIIACNVIYVLVRMLIFHSSFTWKNWIGLIVTSVAYAIPYQQLAQMAKPAYVDNGELLDGGFDMTTGGVCGYLHDVIYITSFVQVSSIISGKFWYTYLVIPAFGAYQSFGFVKGFLSQGSEKTKENDTSDLLERLPSLQQLLFRLLACQVASESINSYITITDGILDLVDKFFEMQRQDAVKELEIYRKSADQAVRLSEFFENCRGFEFGLRTEFIKIEQPPTKLLATLEDYVKEATRTLMLEYSVVGGLDNFKP